MKTYDVMTKFYDGQWQTAPRLIQTFSNAVDAWLFMGTLTKTGFQRMGLDQSFFNYRQDKVKTFGIGAKMYCVVREI